jgi:hypothetical protein
MYDIRMYACMHICMYVYMHTYIYIMYTHKHTAMKMIQTIKILKTIMNKTKQ